MKKVSATGVSRRRILPTMRIFLYKLPSNFVLDHMMFTPL
jgi:hypothetical protein